MKLLTIDIRDIGREGTRRVLDLAELPSGLLALTGENGTGKSTLLEASIAGALYRTMPSRDPSGSMRSPSALLDLAKSRSAHVIAEFEVDGRRVTAKHLIDGEARKIESHLYVDGAPATDGEVVSNGKGRVFAQLVESMFPSWDLVAASRFWAQGGATAFSRLDTPQRRALLRELLGLARLQAVADVAKAKLKASEDEREAAARKLEEAQARMAEVEDARARRAGASQAVADRAAELAQVEADGAAAAEQRDKARAAAEASGALEKLRRLDALEEHARETRQLAERLRGEVEAGREQADAAASGLRRKRGEAQAVSEQRARWTAAQDVARRAEQALAAARRAAPDEEPDVEALKRAVADAEAAAERAERDAEVARAAQAAVASATKDVRAIQARLDDARRRSGMLDTVPCGGEGQFATCGLIGDAVRARDAIRGLEGDAKSAGEALESARAALSSAADPSALQDARRALSAKRGALSAGQDAARAWAELTRREEEARTCRAAVGAEPPPPVDIAEEERQAQRWAANVRESLTRLEIAERDIAQSEREIGAMDRAALEDEARGGVWDGPPLGDLEAEVRRLRSAWREAQERLQAARSDVARIDGWLDRAGDPSAEVGALEEDVTGLTGRIERLRRVRHAFGPKGIQAVLIDSAGPAVSSLATGLLRDATGGERWRVELRTLAEKASGEGHKDVLDVVVHDAETGVSGLVSNISGGEEDLVNAAIGLAISAHHSAVDGIQWATAWADEAGSALTRDRATQWVAMLRTAMSQLGIEQMLVITHDEAVQSACDVEVPIESLEAA